MFFKSKGWGTGLRGGGHTMVPLLGETLVTEYNTDSTACIRKAYELLAG